MLLIQHVISRWSEVQWLLVHFLIDFRVVLMTYEAAFNPIRPGFVCLMKSATP